MQTKLDEYIEEQNLADSTASLYRASVKQYTTFHKKSLDELFDEADREEEQGIRWKKRTLKKRLIDFRKYLYETQSEGTAKMYFARIKTLYKYFEIELHDLPKYKSKQIDKTYEKVYDDIPTRDEIIQAYHEANNVMKCIILFSSSSGMSKVDYLNLTVGDFIKACEGYYSKNNLLDQLHEIRKSENPIPFFEGFRQKTDSRYTTFCSPEATEHICQYLIGRDAKIRKKASNASDDDLEELPCKLEYTDKLFKIDESYVYKQFKNINTKLNFGSVGKFIKFRSHQLRAFHATTLKNLEDVQWSFDEINALQGRKKSKTERAYFTDNVSKLRKKYIESVDSLMLFKSIHTVSSQEYNEVKNEKEFYRKELITQKKEQEAKINKILAAQQELEALLGL